MSRDPEAVVLEILQDYREGSGPFGTDAVNLPVEDAISQIDFRNCLEKANYLTLTGTLNYNRESPPLRNKSVILWEDERWVYDPEEIVRENRKQDLTDLFSGSKSYSDHRMVVEEGKTHYPNNDSAYWYDNAKYLYQNFDSSVLKLVSSCDFDATRLYHHAQENLQVIGGEKAGPLWVREMSHLCHPLDNLWEVEFPVDTRVLTITNKLYDEEFSVDNDIEDVRNLWHQFCSDYDVSPAELDDALWRLAQSNNWTETGKEYVENLLDK